MTDSAYRLPNPGQYELEMLAIRLYELAISNRPPLERRKLPNWLELGITLRKQYRMAAHELIREQSL